MKENKNSMYVLEQPEHTILSVVSVVGDIFPLTQKIHDNLDRLQKISDLVFVFQSTPGNIDKDKFTSLYQGKAWLSSDGNISEAILTVSKYSREIFQKHTMICFLNIGDLQDTKPGIIDKIEKINISSNQRPIYNERRLDPEEYYEIYGTKEKKTWSQRILGDCGNPDIVDSVRRYSTHTSRSSFMLFRPGVMKQIEQEIHESYIGSFTESDPRYFLASVCHYLGLEIYNGDIDSYSI